ncbi:MAG TPA: methyltransferase domain-containing protein [Vicinamibacterales bacterium]|nr:methyltransferase domain-containing protein [Vicinamibacterales bacterium]
MRSRRGAFRLVVVVLVAGAALLVWRYGTVAAFHFLPLGWTGEADRLAAVLRIGPGSRVADIGAGDGRFALEMARRVGASGRVYATEIAERQREVIRRRAADAGLPQLEVVTAGEHATGLREACCDAVFMRNVLHHIDDWPGYASRASAALRPGGFFAVIDFSPGAFLHLAGDHGARPDDVVTAFSRAGYTVVERVDDWGGDLYLVLFRYSPGQR